MTKENYKNLEKIAVNVGVGRLSSLPNFEDKVLPEVMKELSLITGQKPATRPARASIAGFKLRAGTAVGLKVTLRGQRMRKFLDKLVKVALPRVRDFRGLKKESVDQGGNLTMGLKEQLIFPEVNPEVSKVSFGIEITLVPKIRDREKAVALYKELGIPFERTYG